MKRLLFLCISAVAAASGCTTVNFLETRPELQEGRVISVMIEPEDGEALYNPIGLLEVKHTGVMLFGVIPISPGYLSDTGAEFRKAMDVYGANFANVTHFDTWRAPFPLSLIWWVSSSTMRGEIGYVKKPPGSGVKPGNTKNK